MRKVVATGAGQLAAAILTRLAAVGVGELLVVDAARSLADAERAALERSAALVRERVAALLGEG